MDEYEFYDLPLGTTVVAYYPGQGAQIVRLTDRGTTEDTGHRGSLSSDGTHRLGSPLAVCEVARNRRAGCEWQYAAYGTNRVSVDPEHVIGLHDPATVDRARELVLKDSGRL